MQHFLRQSHGAACQQRAQKFIGPSFPDIAIKYKGDAGAESNLAEKVKKGGGGRGSISMPPSAIRDADNRA